MRPWSLAVHWVLTEQALQTAASARKSTSAAAYLVLRRGLGNTVDDLFRATPEDHFAAATVIHPSLQSEPHYVILLVSPADSPMSYDEYQETRLWILSEHCLAVRYLFPDATDIVGIATDLSASGGSSELVAYYDGRTLTEEVASRARDAISKYGTLQNLRHSVSIEEYFPAGG